MKASKQYLKRFEPDFTWKVPSKSEKGVCHNVSFSEMYGWKCDCIAGSMNRECRHKRICFNKINGLTYNGENYKRNKNQDSR